MDNQDDLKIVAHRLVTYVKFRLIWRDTDYRTHQAFVISEVNSRQVWALDIPTSAVWFEFYDQLEATVTFNNETQVLKGGMLNSSPRHYYGGQLLSIDEVRLKLPEKFKALADNTLFVVITKDDDGEERLQPIENSSQFVAQR